MVVCKVRYTDPRNIKFPASKSTPPPLLPPLLLHYYIFSYSFIFLASVMPLPESTNSFNVHGRFPIISNALYLQYTSTAILQYKALEKFLL